MKKRRVLVVTQQELVPPDSLQGLDDQERYAIAMEVDVIGALRKMGHEVQVLGLGDEIVAVRRALEEHRPHLAFNLLNQFRGVRLYESYVVSHLELLRCPYTGCNPRGLLLCGDKALTKKILRFHRIPTPGFGVIARGHKVHVPRRLRFPLFVKAASEESSTGIAQASVVNDEAALRERVGFVHEKLASAALVEEYVAGRELYIGVVGNQRLQALPVWEMTFKNLPEGAEPIATAKVKWDLAYQKRVGIRTGRADALPEGAERRIAHLAKRAYRVLGLSGYARLDLRLSEDGRVSILEVNPNPDLCADEDFAASAKAAGCDYPALLARLMSLGLRRAASFSGGASG